MESAHRSPSEGCAPVVTDVEQPREQGPGGFVDVPPVSCDRVVRVWELLQRGHRGPEARCEGPGLVRGNDVIFGAVEQQNGRGQLS